MSKITRKKRNVIFPLKHRARLDSIAVHISDEYYRSDDVVKCLARERKRLQVWKFYLLARFNKNIPGLKLLLFPKSYFGFTGAAPYDNYDTRVKVYEDPLTLLRRKKEKKNQHELVDSHDS
uniref:Uncharacterized protein n=1 Tax=Glossina pallidipes TaxID=7398 RepID=A0A1A9ZGH0_GLOPL